MHAAALCYERGPVATVHLMFRRGWQASRRRRFNGAVKTGDPRKFKSYGLLVWLRADRGITLNVTHVSAIADQSGNGNHATQGTAANQAAYSATGWSGKPCLDYGSGGAKGYATPSVSLGAFGFFEVLRGDATSGYCLVHETANGIVNANYFYLQSGSSSYIAKSSVTSGKNVSATWASDGVKRSIGKTYNGTHATHRVYSNGVDTNAANSGAGSGDPGTAPRAGALYIGCAETITSSIKGLWAETVVYSSAPPASVAWRLHRRHKAVWALP